MTFETAFAAIVKQRFRREPESRAKWRKIESMPGRAAARALADFCNRGQGPFDTEEKAFFYCMAYMQFHRDGAIRALKRVRGISWDRDRLAMFDFGCGPGTAALALADLCIASSAKAMQMSYLGIDLHKPMRRMVARFADCESVFRPESKWMLRESIAALTDRNLDSWADGASVFIVTCSYVFKQRSLVHENIKHLASCLKKILVVAQDRAVWFAYCDAETPKMMSMLAQFFTECDKLKIEFGSKVLRVEQLPMRRSLLDSDTTRIINIANHYNLQHLTTRVRLGHST